MALDQKIIHMLYSAKPKVMWGEMQQKKQKEKKAPRLAFVALLVAATSVILVLTVTPWNLVPTLVTEDVTVIATTDFGLI